MRCGLLGKTLGHSYSPALHAMLGDYSYALFEKTEAELPDFLRGGGWDGLNVTIPYKKAVVPYCAALSPAAERLQSVNTLVRRPDGTIYGDNTDLAGFLFLFDGSGLDVRGKKALVLGSGGASVTVCEALRQRGAGQVVVISRFGPDNYDNLDRHADAALIVNATPVGMYPRCGEAPLSLTPFPNLEGVLDLIYNPTARPCPRRRSGCKASTPWSAAPTAPSTATTRTSRASSSSLTAAASTSGAKRPWCWAAAARR